MVLPITSILELIPIISYNFIIFYFFLSASFWGFLSSHTLEKEHCDLCEDESS